MASMKQQNRLANPLIAKEFSTSFTLFISTLQCTIILSAFSLLWVAHLLWAELCPPKIHMLKSKRLVCQNMIVFDDGVFKE